MSDWEAKWEARKKAEAELAHRVYDLKQSGMAYKDIANDEQVFSLYNHGRDYKWKPSKNALPKFYAKQCAKLGVDSGGVVVQDADIMNEAIAALHGLGWSDHKIGQVFGFSTKKVQIVLHRLGIQPIA